MDVLRLDPVTYLPDKLLEGYNSMIWTERYMAHGEFEMKTSEVFETLDILPEGVWLSLLDSNQVMIVETRSIGVDSNGYPELTIKGRSLETFLENRHLEATVYGEPWLAFKQYQTSEIASLILWNHLVNATGEDPSREDWEIDTRTPLPNTVVTNSSYLTEPVSNWWLEQGDAYEMLKRLLVLGIVGFQTIRPNHTSGNVIQFDTTRTATRGDVIKTPTSDIPQLRWDIFDGLDRTQHQSDREPVIFHYDSGHIDNPSYLFSIHDYRNVVLVASPNGNIIFQDPDIEPELTGIDRRVLFVDGGSTADQISLIQKGLVELRRHNRIHLFDGAISPISPYEYGRDYFLGDKVSLLARLGFEETMLVSEYIRTEDHEGDRGYPGLSSILV